MRYAFDDYILDTALRELRFRGTIQPAEPQVFDLVLYLLRNRDRVIGYDELIEAVWEGRNVSESTIRNRINAARKLIGDDGHRQCVIRTFPRRGLRFISEVREGDITSSSSATSHSVIPDDESLPLANNEAPIPANHADRSAQPTHRWPVVAVLPFVNLSGDPLQEHLGDGFCEDIITMLARHRTLTVVARNSAFAFKGHTGNIRSAGANLGADYVVEGSVRRIDDSIRVTAHLIQTSNGQLIWADHFDRRMEALFDVLDNITQRIVANIEPEIGSAERARVGRKIPSSLRAWDLFQLGTTHLYRATRNDNREAQRLLRLAIEQDQELAQAHAYLSYAILLSMLYFEAEPEEERLDEAQELARKAMELDEHDAMIRFVYGRVLLARCEYSDALHELEQAVALNPALAVGHCGVGDSLAYEGRYDESYSCFQRAIELSPHDPQRWAFYAYRALAHLFAHEFELASDWAKKATHIPNCHYWPYAHRVAALGHLGAVDQYEQAVSLLLRKRPGFTCQMARKRLFYIKDDDKLDLYVAGLRKAGLPAV
ncbi:winged helix-turn-helix domain-containing protein [Paracoccus methylarcula]|nr:winged helix-turn-helix domain-containing protein [Paracoccus methylarcula]